MKFIENNMYTLQTDYYNSVKVVCTYVEDNTVYFQYTGSTSSFHDYKLNQKTQKLYVWNSKFSSWDSVEIMHMTQDEMDEMMQLRLSLPKESRQAVHERCLERTKRIRERC